MSRLYNLPDSIAREQNPEQRYVYMRGNWDELLADARARDARAGQRGEAMAANSFSSALTTQFLLDAAVTKLQNRWAALKCFGREFSVDTYKPLAEAQVKFLNATDGLVQVNATNFENGDSTVAPVGITPSHYSRSFHVTDSELNSGLRMENLVEINMATLADQVIQTVTAPITAANFTLPAITRVSGNFGWSDMQTAWALLKKSPIHNALLDGEYLAQILNVPSQFQKTGAGPAAPGAWNAFGWDNIALNTNWTAADANTRGFLCGPQAIGVLAGLPLTPRFAESHGLSCETITLPEIGISIAYYTWFSLATRTWWSSFDLMLGASLLDGTAGILVKSS